MTLRQTFQGRLKAALICGLLAATNHLYAQHPFNGSYRGRNLDRVAFPIGGIGAGMFCLEGTGTISHVSVRHQLEFFHEPGSFAALCVLGEGGKPNVAKILAGPIPDWKYFGGPSTGNGMWSMERAYGFPRFHECEFLARFPFATIELRDAAVPLDVELIGWSPFTPPDADASSLPVGALEYRFHNRTDRPCKAVFFFNSGTETRNFLGDGKIDAIEGGFVLRGGGSSFAFFVDEKKVVVDHCWYHGANPIVWPRIVWHVIEHGVPIENPPAAVSEPMATLAVPFDIGPGEDKTIRLLTCWYTPTLGIRHGTPLVRLQSGPAFGCAPSHGTAQTQQTVSGFLGHGLVNTYDGDGLTGTLTSPEFTVAKRYLHFLVGGGPFAGQTCVNLVVDGKTVDSAVGKQNETLAWATFDLTKLAGKTAKIQLVDSSKEGWGHILADHFVLSDEPIAALLTGQGNAITADPKRVTVFQDFEGKDYGAWVADPPVKKCSGGSSCSSEEKPAPSTYVPWYATKFKSIEEVAAYWRANYDDLRCRSAAFRDAFYDTTLPPEVVEAVAANLTILKSPTVLRQHDGRMWAFEGSYDSGGGPAGTTNHVLNYAQAICHLFPSLERGLRQTAFHEGQNEQGAQTCHVSLPILPSFDHVAVDGQLGGIMQVYREWRISGDNQWIAAYWPLVKRSLDFLIKTRDPDRTGLPEKDQFNTYDCSYFGPNGHIGSFYLGALAAAIEMGKALDDDVEAYRALLEKGRKRMESELFNGEYFIQSIDTKDVELVDRLRQCTDSRTIAEEINRPGLMYQYGDGCLSDGVLGVWMAAVCGLETSFIDPAKVRSHLMAVYKYNHKHDLSTHVNTMLRPNFAMGDEGGLLLCTWPRGNQLLFPFPYADEVWTGIEYQAASHLMMLGAVKEGLDIVRTARRRYDGVRRNPFNEYECGHWYVRALSSYGLLQGITGVRYDAVTKTLYADAKVGDFRSFLSTETGFGTVTLRNGKLSVDVKSGTIPVEKTVVKP